MKYNKILQNALVNEIYRLKKQNNLLKSDNKTLEQQLNLHVVGSSNKVDYEKGFNLAMNYISSTTIIMEQSKESEENWVKLKDFIKKHKIK